MQATSQKAKTNEIGFHLVQHDFETGLI